jgi:hypothetical protein
MTDELLLADGTIDVLRNFAAINDGIVIEAGNVLRTVHPRVSLAARVKIPQAIPDSFAIWDLKRFLAALEIFSKPKLIFDGSRIEIREVDGEASALALHYPMTRRDCVRTLEKEPNADPTFVLPLPKDRLKLFIDLGARLNLPHLVLTGNGTSIVLRATDVANLAQVGAELPIGKSNREFQVVFAAEDWCKVLQGVDYHVGIALRDDGAVAHFIGGEGDVHYWMVSRTVHSTCARRG